MSLVAAFDWLSRFQLNRFQIEIRDNHDVWFIDLRIPGLTQNCMTSGRA
jgi:hypothetical protein